MAGALAVVDCILIDGGVEDAEVLKDAGGLGALGARMKLGIAMAASNAMMVTTIMISTSVKPWRSIRTFCAVWECANWLSWFDFGPPVWTRRKEMSIRHA